MAERLYLRLDGDPLYAPETSVPAGTMRDFAVEAPLRPLVSHVATYREDIAAGHDVVERVLPDGALRLIFNFGDAPAAGGAGGPPVTVAGASATPVVLRLRGRLEGVTVTLRPGAALALLGLPAGEIAESALPLEDLWRAHARELLERMAALPDDAARVALLQRELAQRVRDGDATPRAQAQQAARLIADSGGRRALRDVAATVGVGERRLQQIFSAQVGLSPRAFSRLARMHACLRALRAEPAPQWSRLAMDNGFYDQSHLVNEFRALCGLTPTLFLERARA